MIALNQIKQNGQGGHGLALAGVIVGIATLIINMVFAIYVALIR